MRINKRHHNLIINTIFEVMFEKITAKELVELHRVYKEKSTLITTQVKRWKLENSIDTIVTFDDIDKIVEYIYQNLYFDTKHSVTQKMFFVLYLTMQLVPLLNFTKIPKFYFLVKPNGKFLIFDKEVLANQVSSLDNLYELITVPNKLLIYQI